MVEKADESIVSALRAEVERIRVQIGLAAPARDCEAGTSRFPGCCTSPGCGSPAHSWIGETGDV